MLAPRWAAHDGAGRADNAGMRITLTLRHADGRCQTLTGETGRSLMQAAVDAGIDGVVAECGGTMTCATCHVFLEGALADRVPPAGEDEQAMLELTATPRQVSSRLACQVHLVPELDGLEVRLPAAQY